MRTQVGDNSLDVYMSRAEVVLLISCGAVVALLGFVDGWRLGAVVLGSSLLGAAGISLVQSLDRDGA